MSLTQPPPTKRRPDTKEARMTLAAKQALQARGRHCLPNGEIHISATYDYPIALVDTLSRDLARTTGPLLVIEKTKGDWARLNLTELGSAVKAVLQADWISIEKTYRHYKLCPVLRLFLRLRRSLPLIELTHIHAEMPTENAAGLVANVDRVLAMVRRRLRSIGLKRDIDNFSRGARDNFAKLMNGVDWLAQRHRYVASVRLDLYGGPPQQQGAACCSAPPVDEAHKLAAQRDDYARWMRRKFGDLLLTVAASFEHGPHRGCHIHLWAVFKSSVADDIEEFVDDLGRQWQSQTGGDDDCFFNGNKKVGAFRYPMVGHIDLHEFNTIEGIRAVCTYFTAASLFVKLDIARLRTFRMWGFPKGPLNKPGPKPKLRSPIMRVPLHIARDRFVKWI